MPFDSGRANGGRKPKDNAKAPVLRLDENLSYRLSILNFLMSKATQEIYRPDGLTSHQWKVLSVLNSFAPMAASEVARWVTFDKAAISRAVQQLLKLGLAQRSARKSDGRTISISLTSKGRRTYTRMACDMATLQDKLLAGMTDQEKTALFKVIDRLEARLKDDLAQPDPG